MTALDIEKNELRVLGRHVDRRQSVGVQWRRSVTHLRQVLEAVELVEDLAEAGAERVDADGVEDTILVVTDIAGVTVGCDVEGVSEVVTGEREATSSGVELEHGEMTPVSDLLGDEDEAFVWRDGTRQKLLRFNEVVEMRQLFAAFQVVDSLLTHDDVTDDEAAF